MNKLYFIALLFVILAGCNETSGRNTETTTQSSQHYNQCDYTQYVSKLENYYKTNGGAKYIYQAQPNMEHLLRKIKEALNIMSYRDCSSEIAHLKQLYSKVYDYNERLKERINIDFQMSKEIGETLSNWPSILDD